MLAITLNYIKKGEEAALNYNKLRYFYEASRTLNLTRAAQNLYISQPALSKHISDLENDFGTPIFVRTNRNLILTQAGEVLREECCRIFDREEELYRRVRAAAAQEVGNLSLAFMGIGAAYRIPELLSQFRKKYPQISVQTRRLNWDMVYDAVESGHCEVGLKLSSGKSYPEHIGRCILREDRVAAVLPSSHPLAGCTQISLDQLKDDPFLFLEKEGSSIPHDHALRMCREAGFTPHIAAVYPNVETVVMMVQGGAGVSLLSSFAPMQGLSGVVCVPLNQAPAISLDLLWRKDTPNPAIKLFTAFAEEFAW